MQRVKCTISYDGTLFSGYQVQVDKRTVQSEFEKALTHIHKGLAVRIAASGRTDAGVHAKGQVVHFDTKLMIPPANWKKALNSMLPEDISVVDVELVDNHFHSRYDAKGKEYRYFINLSKERNPFNRNYAFHYPYPLDVSKIVRASSLLLGTHDFTSFCSAKTDVEDKIRTIMNIDCTQSESELILSYQGNGFLYNMVRILTGTLLEVGAGARDPDDLLSILQAKDRNKAGKTAPPQGLFLWEVFY
ncbi:tRNA pseudouridine(38-40) synthase TruA [Peribacillus acanthi]|uniref:tRNA pseudouridine(38-40) synthase TruA n=1 Tax=Peribacillus acanthi TaxID=2171554 RepID=UPI000D3E17BC|nr:tRNA pseudouridine(38-40) synthase TruA [Peribacillus acanthi]